MNLLRLTELYFPEERQEYATNNIFNLYKYNKMKMVSWMWKGSSKDKNK